MTTITDAVYHLPHSLLDLLSNTIILNNLISNLPLPAIFRLSHTSRTVHQLVLNNPDTFRYVDLSKCKGTYIRPIQRIDSGGHSWRAERMDEALTEDDFYAGPLRFVLGRLRKLEVLIHIQTLVLDGLASVTNDLVTEIVTSSEYNVRLLSLRRCVNINHSKLQQLVSYVCRPSRPPDTPRLRGLYIFTDPSVQSAPTDSHGVTTIDGAQLGVPPTSKGPAGHGAEAWYGPNGQLVQIGHKHRTAWEETLQASQGIIWFDAVPCMHMHRAMSKVLPNHTRSAELSEKPGVPTIATRALGPSGCTGCGRAPEGAPVWGKDDIGQFPLLWPPPHTGKLIDAIRPPPLLDSAKKPVGQRLIVSCTWCTDNRYCESCYRWWCIECYDTTTNVAFQTLEQFHDAGMDAYLSGRELMGPAPGSNMKVFNGFCVENCLVGEWMAYAGGAGMWN